MKSMIAMKMLKQFLDKQDKSLKELRDNVKITRRLLDYMKTDDKNE